MAALGIALTGCAGFGMARPEEQYGSLVRALAAQLADLDERCALASRERHSVELAKACADRYDGARDALIRSELVSSPDASVCALGEASGHIAAMGHELGMPLLLAGALATRIQCGSPWP